jgi:16S rRNA (guanine966-N2)-methyltransferase
MRISGGTARGITLRVPKGDRVRPATDGMRQAVFSSLGWRVEGARFLDLFAGSGAYGLEALSRGASGGVFVEKDAEAIGCIRHNLAAVCRSLGRTLDGLEIRKVDAGRPSFFAGIRQEGLPADLVFVDPPYELIGSIAPILFEGLLPGNGSEKAPMVAFEMPGETLFEPAGWRCVRRLGTGRRQPTVAFFEAVRP